MKDEEKFREVRLFIIEKIMFRNNSYYLVFENFLFKKWLLDFFIFFNKGFYFY